MDATFSHKVQLLSDTWEFFIHTKHPIVYQPGQYLDVTIPDVQDQRGAMRTFSLTSLPSDLFLSFVTRVIDGGSAYKQHLFTLQSGDKLHVSQAMGDLVLPRDVSRPIVFIAGGLGVASFVGMARHTLTESANRLIRLYYALHRPADELFAPLFDTCPSVTKHLYTSPQRLSGAAVLETHTPATMYFISGSEPFTMHFRDELMAHGVTPGAIAYDFFDGYNPTEV